jgi:hypothetical protein
MKRVGSQANDWINDTVSRNPLMVGALGLAVGAVIAAALPSTRQEDQFLGSAADDLKRKAGDAALEGVEMAKDLAADVYNEVGDRAHEQGLSANGVADFAGQVGEKVKAVVASVTGGSGDSGNQRDYSPRTTSGATG